MIVGIYLAAGQSRRMGCHKLSLSIDGKPIGSIALQTALESVLDKIIVVTGVEDTLTWLPSLFFKEPFRRQWIHQKCESSIDGQAESIKCGLMAAQQLKAQAVMILLGDQPLITKDMVNQLVQCYKENRVDYVASSFNQIIRPPVLFDSKLFHLLFQLKGDQGARRYIRNNDQGMTIEFQGKIQFLDVDTPMQYEEIKKIYSKKINKPKQATLSREFIRNEMGV